MLIKTENYLTKFENYDKVSPSIGGYKNLISIGGIRNGSG